MAGPDTNMPGAETNEEIPLRMSLYETPGEAPEDGHCDSRIR